MHHQTRWLGVPILAQRAVALGGFLLSPILGLHPDSCQAVQAWPVGDGEGDKYA
jgi:hypothetical protein